jgi:hypothetical protein
LVLVDLHGSVGRETEIPRLADCLAISLSIIRGGVGPNKVVTHNLQIGEYRVRDRNSMNSVPRTNCAVLANCVGSLWHAAQQSRVCRPYPARKPRDTLEWYPND